MQFLFEIEDVFDISGRGCVVVPGIPCSFASDVRVGSRLLVEAPSGARLETTILAFELINRGRRTEHAPFMVPRSILKEQLPIGSRVFLMRDEHV